MGKGYESTEIRQKLIDLLDDSKTGMSGVEISKKLGVNRTTMTKYLKVFAAEGFLRQNNIGNITLWFLESGQEAYSFPDDYFKVAPQYLEKLVKGQETQIYSLIKNCLNSGASVPKLVTEVIIPSIDSIQKLYDDGKIGNTEEKLLQNIISKSLQIFNQISIDSNPKNNIIVISADAHSSLLSEAASASLHSDGWKVFHLGDMSSAINVLFDLDLQKLMGKIWKQKSGIMIILVFSNTEEGLHFFAESVNSIKEKLGKRVRLALCGKVGKKTKIQSDLISEKFEDVLQWSKTVSESSK
ncbi:MAG: transcriptional regulator [Nitrosopumilales archaeon CG15_BIG_FIL_POST_REV_8_21_14_020_33_23]|nr:MAG: transcriptional regulator [Nitrosopumilales archaeon CG15_BIG_FIL_POST_REV_8_21_14_020_33_23]PIY89622.1 MAG: transcriptional regulator [Nitrosopumilales archaeon CG_4_10_14_0_8_um_filter_34_8]PJB98572.1 MAG: transcriptional regulator [Nitrosopumilales archaeon CG_4_9_14_0_8_um_filter_34_10]